MGTPLLDLVGPKPYVGFQSALDSTVVHGWNYYWKSTHLPELRDDLIDVIAGHAFSCSSPRSGLAAALWRLGRHQEAIGHYQAMLKLNPNDNQGIRYVLAGYLLARDPRGSVKIPRVWSLETPPPDGHRQRY